MGSRMSAASAIECIPIERHGLVGDRRTGALIGADGGIAWWCLPHFDSPTTFGSVLDPERGGGCRLAPAEGGLGRQRYDEGTVVLRTSWPEAGLEVADVMAEPSGRRPGGAFERTLIRRVRAARECAVNFECRPRRDFGPPLEAALKGRSEATFQCGGDTFSVWASFPLRRDEDGVGAELHLAGGDEHWVVLGWNRLEAASTTGEAARLFADAARYWLEWSRDLRIGPAGPRAPNVLRSAITVQLLSVPENDCAIAALTTSLPERIGGDRNYDYRFVWIRDASLALSVMSRLGRPHEAKGFLDWVCRRPGGAGMPLQVCYGADGRTDLDAEEIPGVRGYGDSRPVRRGNGACRQKQLGAMGFLADCLLIYLRCGGTWHAAFWSLLEKLAAYICDHWNEPDNGIWELPIERDFVSSRVMGWVVLDRALKIGARTGSHGDFARWREAAIAIRSDIMVRGWSGRKRAFRQHLGSDALDAASLLIPLMGFLPAAHPYVRSTVEALERELVVNGLLHRFNPTETLDSAQLPIGEFEGAFLPAVFWHAHTLVALGRLDDADSILTRCEAAAGETGLFAEELDARSGRMLGNLPLLFTHVEYVRAATALEKALKGRRRPAPASATASAARALAGSSARRRHPEFIQDGE